MSTRVRDIPVQAGRPKLFGLISNLTKGTTRDRAMLITHAPQRVFSFCCVGMWQVYVLVISLGVSLIRQRESPDAEVSTMFVGYSTRTESGVKYPRLRRVPAGHDRPVCKQLRSLVCVSVPLLFQISPCFSPVQERREGAVFAG